ncbi:MAG TPA: hypothetical protein VFM05_04815 [Candidatus Saccharimonadales bacterium]|nr:hypothetical protein [Candidatus Saccharimonadales bacterium]
MKGRFTPVTCAHCGGSVYEYSSPGGRVERAVNMLTGCTVYSCYACGLRGWQRNGRSNLWVATLAKTIQVMIPFLIVLLIVILLLGFLMR